MNPREYRQMYDVEDSHWWYVGVHNLILATIQSESKRLGRPLEIFDAGCGTGRLCQLLTEQGHNVSGCDASEEAIHLCRQRGISRVYQADLNALELEPVTFDIIISIDVLYHTGIIDDVAVMRRLLNGLKSGGLLIMNLVAHEFLRSAHDIAVHTRERYTKDSLCLRLLKAGFKIDFASYRVSILFPFIALYRLMLRQIRLNKTDVDSDVTSMHSFINYLLLLTVKTENFLLQFTPLPIGSSVFVTARRTADRQPCGT